MLQEPPNRTDLMSLVNQLRATLGKMEVALGSIADAIVWTGTDGKVQWCNTAFDKLVNRPHILTLNVKLNDLLPLAQAGQAIPFESYPHLRALAGQYDITEYEFQQGEQSLILEISGNCIEMAEGDCCAVLVLRDVTQAKRIAAECQEAEAALSNSESKFRRIVENANDIISLIDLEGKIVYISPNLTPLTGNTTAELEGKPFMPFLHPDDQPHYAEAFHRVVTTGQRQSDVAYRARMKNGLWQWQVTNLSASHDDNGNLLIVSVARDITDRKQAEEDLRDSERKYRNIFENSQVGIGRTRIEDGLFLDVNQRYAEIMGFDSPTDLIGKRFSTEFYANPDDRDFILTELEQRGEVRNFEEELRRPDGSTTWGLLSIRTNPEAGCLDFVIADISEAKRNESVRKRLAEELRQSQQFLDNMIDNIPLAVFVKDVKNDFRYVLINKGSGRILGFTKEVAIGCNDHDLIPQAQADAYRAEDLQTLMQGTMLEYSEQWKQVHADSNETIALRYWKLPLFDPQGNATHLLCISEDITDRKQAEAALQHRIQMDGLLSSLSRHVLDQDVDVAINFALQKLGEFTHSDRSYVFQFHSDQTKLDNTHEWCAAGIEPFIDAAQDCPVNSWSCEILLSANVLNVPDVNDLPPEAAIDQAEWKQQSIQSLLVVPMIYLGEVIGCIGLDAVRTRQDWSADTIRLLQLIGEMIAIAQARHRAEEKFTKAFRASPSPISITTRSENRFLDVNPSFLRMSGCSLTDLLGRTTADLNLGVAPKAYGQAMQQLLETGSLYNHEVPFRTKLGEIKIVLLSIELIDLSGTQCVLNIINDITERKRLENEFISLVSHELRTPLTSLMGGLYLLGSGQLGSLTPQGQQVLNIAITNSERLIRLVNDILDLERIKSGKMTLQPVRCNVANLLIQAAEAMQTMADQAQITLVTEPFNIELYVDCDRILQTLTNLLSNAIKFSEPGSTVWLRAYQHSNQFQIQVQDQGRGIPSDKLQMIFERFQQVDKSDSRQKGGTGLGLAICRNIIEQHDGKIWVESVLGQGSTFYSPSLPTHLNSSLPDPGGNCLNATGNGH